MSSDGRFSEHWPHRPANDSRGNRGSKVGCREHIDEIVTWLVDEANKRDWWRYIVAVPGSKYFMKRLVLLAIKKAEINLS